MSVDSRPAAGHVDRSGWLRVFGVFEIILGLLALLFAALMASAILLSSRLGPAAQAGAVPQALSINLLFYASTAAFLITMGIGTIRARRWARVLMLLASWPALLGIPLGFVMVLLLMPAVLAQAPGAGGGKDMQTAVTVFVVVLGCLMTLPPLAFVLFYSGRNVQATFAARDPTPSWVDGRPLPVLGFAMAMGICGLGSLMALSYGVTFYFGWMLTGWPARLGILVNAVLWFWLGRQIYWMTRAGWWASVLFVVLTHLSGWVSFAVLGPQQVMELSGRSAMVRALDPASSGAMLAMFRWFMPASLVLWLASLVWLRRRYYHAEGDPLRSTG